MGILTETLIREAEALELAELEKFRTICDLRIMHGKVDELYNLVKSLRDGRHSVENICHFSDPKRLKMNIDHMDDVYAFFVNLRSEFNYHCAENSKLIDNGQFVKKAAR